MAEHGVILTEGFLQGVVAAGYDQLEGRGLSLYRYDSLSQTFPDLWYLQDGLITRRYGDQEREFTLGALRNQRQLLITDTQTADHVCPALHEGVRSFVATPVLANGAPWGVLYVNSPQPDAFGPDDLRFIAALARQIGQFVQQGNSPASGEVELATVRVLAATVDAKDPYTRHHSTNVSFYARRLARQMSLAPEEVRHIELAGLLHDIGKIAIPDQVLQKPGRLSPEERHLIQSHAAIGADILAQAGHLRHLVPLVRHHHEWHDGNGYPDGLKGSEIPLGAAIISVVDAFDTMTTKRVYRAALTLDEALAELRAFSGRQFHPEAVMAMIGLVEEARQTRERWLTSLGHIQGEELTVLDPSAWRSLLTDELEDEELSRDPLDFLVEARHIQLCEELPPVLRRGGNLALHFWAADVMQIYLIDRPTATLTLAWLDGRAGTEQLLSHCRQEGPISMSQGLLGWVALTGQSLTIADARRDPRWAYSAAMDGPVSVMVAPIMARGVVLGLLQLISRGESRFGRTDMKVAKLFSSLLGPAIDRVTAPAAQPEIPGYDPLTGLYDATYLQGFLARLERGEVAGPLSVACVDGDDLREINVRHGHEAGDLIVQHIARCLVAWQREGDCLVRTSGDEFYIFFPGLTLPEAAARLEQIRMAVSETPVEFDACRLYVSISCGVTEVDLDKGPHSALRVAERAMFNAKRTGKNRVWTAAG